MANELYHFGVRGMKWGVRRYQNQDGSYKAGAEGRYDPNGGSGTGSRNGSSSGSKSSGSSESGGKKFQLSNKQKTALKVGVAVAGTALAAYGAYKLSSLNSKAIAGLKKADMSKADELLKSAGMNQKYAREMGEAANAAAARGDLARAKEYLDIANKNNQYGMGFENRAYDLAARSGTGKYTLKDKVQYLKGDYRSPSTGTLKDVANSAKENKWGVRGGEFGETAKKVLSSEKSSGDKFAENFAKSVTENSRLGNPISGMSKEAKNRHLERVGDFASSAKNNSAVAKQYSSVGDDFTKELLSRNMRSLGL